jgi:glycine oxidase
MDKELLIVGHGLAGCVLALTCYRRNIPFSIVGYTLPGEASMASSGLIAPITGRRYVKAWRIDEFRLKALDFYRWTEKLLDGEFFFPVEIVRYLSHREAKVAWEKRLHDPEYAEYISDIKYPPLDELNRPYGILTGGYRLDTPGWIEATRRFLMEKGILKILKSPYDSAPSNDGIRIFATGAVDVSVAGRIIPNKGEALLVYMPEWTIRQIIKEEVFIVPLAQQGYYWIGSYYQPWPESTEATEEGKKRLLESILRIYSGRLEIVKHLAGVRPTVNDRRPLIGAMPLRTRDYVFNGMGTKGTSLAPFWADQLITHITEGAPLPEEVAPDRYIP